MEEIQTNETKTPSENKTPNKRNIIIGVIVSVIVVIAIIVSVYGTSGTSTISGNSSSSQKLEISNVTMSVEYTSLGYSAVVKGTAKNNKKDYSYASVEFSIYDNAGNNLGTALANINNLFKGDSWQFEAHLIGFSNTQPSSYKLVEISAW